MKTRRVDELETFMAEIGLITISSSLLEMWQMFLIVFVKRELFADTANVSAMKIAKGAMKGTIGNKGGIAYNFTLENHNFNIVAVHLRHGQNAVAERN